MYLFFFFAAASPLKFHQNSLCSFGVLVLGGKPTNPITMVSTSSLMLLSCISRWTLSLAWFIWQCYFHISSDLGEISAIFLRQIPQLLLAIPKLLHLGSLFTQWSHLNCSLYFAQCKVLLGSTSSVNSLKPKTIVGLFQLDPFPRQFKETNNKKNTEHLNFERWVQFKCRQMNSNGTPMVSCGARPTQPLLIILLTSRGWNKG